MIGLRFRTVVISIEFNEFDSTLWIFKVLYFLYLVELVENLLHHVDAEKPKLSIYDTLKSCW